jgi:hypothetical protein
MNKNRVKRKSLTSIFLGIAIAGCLLWASIMISELLGITSFGLDDNFQELVFFGLFNILFIICSTALLNLKKWGAYGLVVVGVVFGFSYFLFFESSSTVFYQIPIGALFFATLFTWRHIHEIE